MESISKVGELFSRIMCSESIEEMMGMETEISESLSDERISESDSMILILAIQTKLNNINMMQQIVAFAQEDIDLEEKMVNEAHEKELQEVKDGNILNIKDLKKKK